MSTFRARVLGGHLVLSEPTDLPEGTEVELAAVGAGGNEVGEVVRAAIEATLAASAKDIETGRLVRGDDVLDELRARRS